MSEGEGDELGVALSLRCGLRDRLERRMVPLRGNNTPENSLAFRDRFQWSAAGKGIRSLAVPKGASGVRPKLSRSHCARLLSSDVRTSKEPGKGDPRQEGRFDGTNGCPTRAAGAHRG